MVANDYDDDDDDNDDDDDDDNNNNNNNVINRNKLCKPEVYNLIIFFLLIFLKFFIGEVKVIVIFAAR